MKADAYLKHGWTLSHVDILARHAVMGNLSWWAAGDRVDQIDLARFAIVEHLYASDDVPARTDLLQAAQRALTRDKEAELRAHGIPVSSRETGARFATFWYQGVQGSHEDRIVEVLAMRQIFPELPESHQRALLALAATGDYKVAPERLGINPNTFQTHISRGRKSFRGLWHEGEEPSRSWGRDRRAGVTVDVLIDPHGRASATARIRRRQRKAESARSSLDTPNQEA